MTVGELTDFLKKNTHIEWADDWDNQRLHFRNTRLPWYQKDKTRSTAIEYHLIDGMNDDDLLRAINRGLEVEGITRITGYFSMVSHFNKGKIGELRDRRKTDLYGNPQGIMISSLHKIQAEILEAV